LSRSHAGETAAQRAGKAQRWPKKPQSLVSKRLEQGAFNLPWIVKGLIRLSAGRRKMRAIEQTNPGSEQRPARAEHPLWRFASAVHIARESVCSTLNARLTSWSACSVCCQSMRTIGTGSMFPPRFIRAAMQRKSYRPQRILGRGILNRADPVDDNETVLEVGGICSPKAWRSFL
jgi:hypothetical protein